MGAVVKAVTSAVSDVVEAVGDVVEDVVDVVVDVVEGVGDVVQAVIDDPIPVLVAVAGQMVGIPAPVTMGALTAARGGDLEDIALSMGTAYFAPSVGNAISSTVSSSFIEAGFNETFSQVASKSISQGLVNGTVAEIKGGSFDDGFAGGFTGGMVNGGVGEVASYVKPDIIELAQESGLNLQEANSLYSAGTRAFSAGITAEVTGSNDFAIAFSNSAVGSGIDAGTRSLNNTIDEQFRTAATDWNEKDETSEPIEVAVSGAGIPNDVVSEVQVSDIGVDNNAGTDTIDKASVLAQSGDEMDFAEPTTMVGEKATSDISTLPEPQLAEAPIGETIYDFADIIGEDGETSDKTVLADASDSLESDVPPEVTDIAQGLSGESNLGETTEPVGGLASVSEPQVDELGSLDKPAVVSEAPVAGDLLKTGLAADEPVGGLNAVAQVTPEQKLADAQGLKATDFTKPMVATVGNLLKQTYAQKRRPAPRAPVQRPIGALQVAKATTPKPAPKRMDVANLIPIQKAAPTQQVATQTRVAPPKTLTSGAKLTPVTNIASLTSLVKKEG